MKMRFLAKRGVQFCVAVFLCVLVLLLYIFYYCTTIVQPMPKRPCEEEIFYSKSKDSSTRNKLCIERNICRNASEKSNIYYYKRTDFYAKLNLPVYVNATINHTYDVVPRKVHFCHFVNTSRDFKFYGMIAILAVARFVKPDVIYFWHDKLPKGRFWAETIRRVNTLYLIRRRRPSRIYGNPVGVLEHVADIVRLEALLEYGGMYFDMDSIVVNPIDTLLRYDVTMGHAIPNVLANGIMFAKPWSDFQKIWHKEYRNFKDSDWGGMSVLKPFKLSRIYPNLIHIEPASLCRPNWRELNHLFGDKPWDYKQNNYVVHLYMRFARGKWHTPEEIRTWDTTVGSIMRYIYFCDSSLQINGKWWPV